MAIVSAADRLVDLDLERAIDILRLEAGTRNKALVLLVQLGKDIATAIMDADPSGPVREVYRRQRLAKLQKAVESAIRAAYRGTNVLMAREIRNVVELEATWTANAINTAISVEFADAGITTTLLDTLTTDILIQGAPSSEWWGRQAAGLSARFADEMRSGMLLGETNAKLVERVRGTSSTRGLMDIAKSSAERLVRASVQTAANVGRESTYAQNDDLIASLEWHATLDTRTSPWCIVRDGKHYSNDKGHKPLDSDVPWLQGPGKLHWGCRSTSVPVLKSWRELGIDEAEVPETTRASMDGQVPAKLTFEEWLRKQSQARQDAVLGEGKADLWRRGKITFRDLLDQNGRPLTTEQLREKAAQK